MNNNNTTDFEKLFHDDLYMYLRSTDMVDERLPEAPDLEQLWPQLGQSYVADGIREYNTGYPSVALGWIMFLGMAVAKYWDVEWDTYSKETQTAICTWKKAQQMPIVPLLPPFISCILWVLLWS